jgi:hypothetical protein
MALLLLAPITRTVRRNLDPLLPGAASEAEVDQILNSEEAGVVGEVLTIESNSGASALPRRGGVGTSRATAVISTGATTGDPLNAVTTIGGLTGLSETEILIARGVIRLLDWNLDDLTIPLTTLLRHNQMRRRCRSILTGLHSLNRQARIYP